MDLFFSFTCLLWFLIPLGLQCCVADSCSCAQGWTLEQIWCLTEGRPVKMSGKNEQHSEPLMAEQEQARAQVLLHWSGKLFSPSSTTWGRRFIWTWGEPLTQILLRSNHTRKRTHKYVAPSECRALSSLTQELCFELICIDSLWQPNGHIIRQTWPSCLQMFLLIMWLFWECHKKTLFGISTKK